MLDDAPSRSFDFVDSPHEEDRCIDSVVVSLPAHRTEGRRNRSPKPNPFAQGFVFVLASLTVVMMGCLFFSSFSPDLRTSPVFVGLLCGSAGALFVCVLCALCVAYLK